MLFGEPMPAKKLAGVVSALGGICAYSLLRIQAAAAASHSAAEPVTSKQELAACLLPKETPASTGLKA